MRFVHPKLGKPLRSLGRQAIQSGETAPQRVRLLLRGLIIVVVIAALLFVNISAELGESYMLMSMPGSVL
ncbi:hypothetical protein G7B40_031205 [Aetokthonos hydrillicola Thurmond2011]|uniref:Uncharacterized protein n=1 Tax=Aetokthonos hydrillicola Thurmond2011 TaxID=2712845 RepID=A0AAP5ID21_9CYAN|nr:hypothetical protein [Aetokthonos hydrillicola CCALA 1050]MBW4590532.1 hypothetical protein [Aetokthonos hydrillicola CCALA 1050]MDR9898994.1 hypothetical protein [Aetokthonos hydrillicola Thurmond2011]